MMGKFAEKLMPMSCLGLALILSCSQPRPEEVVASFDNTTITVGDLQKVLRRQGDIYQEKKTGKSSPFYRLKEKVLHDMIDQKLLVREAVVRGTYIDEEEFQKELGRYKSSYNEVSFQRMLQERSMTNEEWVQLRRDHFLIGQFVKEGKLAKTDFSPDEIRQYYQSHLEQFKNPESVHVRQIVTDTKEKAESILRRLQNGENFAKLARDLSLSPDRKEGGDLGFITRGSFPKEFEVCFSMNPGEISPIIPSLYGFHLFKVLEKSPAKTLDLLEVHDRIVNQLKLQAQQNAVKNLLQELRQKAKIQIHEEVLERITV